MKKVAVFVDWENIRIGIFEKAARHPSTQVNYNDENNIIKFICAFLDPKDEEIYRIFFYLTDPYGDKIKGVDYSKTQTYINATSLIDRLGICDHIAIRKGTLVVRGFDSKKKPIFQQKKVDMLRPGEDGRLPVKTPPGPPAGGFFIAAAINCSIFLSP